MNAARLFLASKLIGLLPPSRAFAFKRALLRFAGAVMGNNVRIVSSAEFYCSGALSLGDNSWTRRAPSLAVQTWGIKR